MPREAKTATSQLRMKDLVSRSGLSRDTIHFYMSEGLVPPPTKKRRNMAWYGPEHLERLETIKKLQQERFLPLKAIKAVLSGEAGETAESGRFTTGQERLIEKLKTELSSEVVGSGRKFRLDELVFADELTAGELGDLQNRGVIELEHDGKNVLVSPDDAEILRGLVEIKRTVDRPDGSWRAEDWQMLDQLAQQLIEYEINVFVSRFQDVGPRPIDEVVETTVPIINRVFGIFHMKKIRAFLSAFEPSSSVEEEPAKEAAPPKRGSGSR